MRTKFPLQLPVLCLFVLSGFTSLIYQAVWIRLLSLAVGSTSESMSLVLSLFFLGLALGSWSFGKMSHRIRSPLLMYGILEAVIGVLAFFIFWILYFFPQYVSWLYPGGVLSTFGHFLKYSIVFVILILPTFAMGASLPLLVKLFDQKEFRLNLDSKKQVSLLYAINTVGAILGALGSGFLLYPRIGIDGANMLAVGGNFMIGVVALLIHRRLPNTLQEQTVSSPASSEIFVSRNSENSWFGLRTGFLFLAAFLVGFISISMEVIWFKYLGIFLGTNIFGLSLILGLFLLGITVGSLGLSAYLRRGRDLQITFLYILTIAILLTLVSVLILGVLPILSNVLGYYLGHLIHFVSIKSLLAFLVLFVPTIFLGALLPLSIEILNEIRGQPARNSGYLYSINTLGGILGSCLTGLVFIPHLGSAWSTKMNLILLVILLAMSCALYLKTSMGRLKGGVIALVLLGLSQWAQVDFLNVIRSAYQQSLPAGLEISDLLKVYSRKQEDFKFVYEGETAIISLSHDADDGPDFQKYLRLKTNGLNESIYNLENRSSLPKYEALLGLLPYSLVRDPKSAFVVGYGGGYSALFFESTDIKKLLVAEIEEGILKAAEFAHDGEFPFKNAGKVELKVEDARFLLAAGAGGPYDIIASQPSHSWLSGVANLFTEEFFRIVDARLTEHGVFSQWLNLYNMDAEVLDSILKTFFTVFPHGAVFSNIHDEELILIGSRHPVKFNLKKLDAIFKSPVIAQKVADIPLLKSYDLISHFVLSREDFMSARSAAKINTDLNAFAEISQSRLFYKAGSDSVKTHLDQLFTGNYDQILSEKLDISTLEGILQTLYRSQSYNKYNRLLEKYVSLFAKDQQGQSRLAYYLFLIERYQSALDVLKQAEVYNATRVQLHLLADDFEAAASALGKMGTINQHPCAHLELAIRTKDLGSVKRALQILNSNSGAETCGGQFDFLVGSGQFLLGDKKKAQASLGRFFEQQPQRLKVIELLLAIAIESELREHVTSFAEYYITTLNSERARLASMQSWMTYMGYDRDAQFIGQLKGKLGAGP